MTFANVTQARVGLAAGVRRVPDRQPGGGGGGPGRHRRALLRSMRGARVLFLVDSLRAAGPDRGLASRAQASRASRVRGAARNRPGRRAHRLPQPRAGAGAGAAPARQRGDAAGRHRVLRRPVGDRPQRRRRGAGAGPAAARVGELALACEREAALRMRRSAGQRRRLVDLRPGGAAPEARAVAAGARRAALGLLCHARPRQLQALHGGDGHAPGLRPRPAGGAAGVGAGAVAARAGAGHPDGRQARCVLRHRDADPGAWCRRGAAHARAGAGRLEGQRDERPACLPALRGASATRRRSATCVGAGHLAPLHHLRQVALDGGGGRDATTWSTPSSPASATSSR